MGLPLVYVARRVNLRRNRRKIDRLKSPEIAMDFIEHFLMLNAQVDNP